MNYFNDCKDLSEAKTVYRKLCLQFHPDKGGTAKQFIELKKQFEEFVPKKENFNFDKFHNMVMKFEGLEGVTVSFVGNFIWLSGNTKVHKDTIKDIKIDNFNPARYASKKKVWYFSPQDYERKGRKTYELSEIKAKYGAKEFQPQGYKTLN